MEDNQP